LLTEAAHIFLVPLHCAIPFCLPPFLSGFGLRLTELAFVFVPETSIDEYNQSATGENHIRTTGKFSNILEEPESTTMEVASYRPLKLCIC
jgi:hypothetical protein